MGFYGIMVVECFLKNFSSRRCLAGLKERTATMGLKKCLSLIDCSRESWTMYLSTIQLVSESDEGASHCKAHLIMNMMKVIIS